MAKRVAVFGGSGMLGAMVVSVLAEESGIEVAATVRHERLRDMCEERLPDVEWRLFEAGAVDDRITAALDGCEWAVNAIGITKPLIRDDDPVATERAIRVNASFPYELASQATKQGLQVLQIATDCVYSGARGRYLESDPHDALDVYGKTKSLGEAYGESMHHLRCSIIGPEPKDHKFLLDWFVGQPEGSTVNGFANHMWNGVTTLHFARLCLGVIRENASLSHLQHVIPTDMVTKHEMLKAFASAFGRNDIQICEVEATTEVDRTLATEDDVQNRRLWENAGYSIPPTVAEMIDELARYNLRLGNLA